MPALDVAPREQTAARVRAGAARHPLALLTVGTAMYATGPVMVAASSISGPVFSLWRLWAGVVAFAAAVALQAWRGGPPRLGWVRLRWAVAAGAVFGAHQLLLFSAVKVASVADVTLLSTLAPVVTGVIAVPAFGERPGRGFWAGAAVAMAGTTIVVLGATAGPSGSVLGLVLAGGNVIGLSGFFLLAKQAREDLGVLPFLLAVLTVAAVVVTLWNLAAGTATATVGRTDVVLVLAVALGPGFLGHVVTVWPLARLPANVPPLFRLAQPALAGGLAAVFLSQPITVWHVVGGAIVAGGVAAAVTSDDGRRLLAGPDGGP